MEMVDYIRVWQHVNHSNKDCDICFRIYDSKTDSGTTFYVNKLTAYHDPFVKILLHEKRSYCQEII